MNSEYEILGLMSGTSLDGLDIALCTFTETGNGWNYLISFAETVPYPEVWKSRLVKSHQLCSEDLIKLDRDYGNYIAGVVNKFLKKNCLKPQIISSHGHTVFHAPSQGYTLQLGHGPNISAGTGLPVIFDFRSTDIALGGQGAPLVPIGDKLLFPEYDACLNLGGFANISFDLESLRRAFDICPVNIILNHFAESNGLPYDKDGILGRQGEINKILFDKLENLQYYKASLPKSLSREWLEEVFIHEIESVNCPEQDKIHTVYLHIASQIAKTLEQYSVKKVLVTGGGAYNILLTEIIRKNFHSELILPDNKTIEFKEALIFAFLGLLRSLNRTNCLASVTGASKDSSCGVIHYNS